MILDPGPPVFAHLEFDCAPSAAKLARDHASDTFGYWRIPESTLDDARVVVSELVTNAIKHAARPARSVAHPYVLTLCRMPDCVVIYVQDGDRTPPVLRKLSDGDGGGRGLHLVEQLSAQWGYAYPSPGFGKSVWAKLVVPELSPG
ncbi:ATP-binding protein [Streptomyces sp. CA-111067]|uniref:ATP-binding protein n=1 Tax=Streptomyces sp. CA-111067 TaxID=3240046 RepID=UPI003D96843B